MVKRNWGGGKRSNAGRKGFKEENLARELVGIGGDICKRALLRQDEFEKIDTLTYLDLAKSFAVKCIPQKFEG